MLRQIQEFFERCLQGLAQLGAAIVRPIERLVGGATDKVLTAADQVDKVESVLFKLLRVITWPFRLIFGLLRLILPEAVVSLLINSGHGIQDMLGRLGTGVLHVAGILNLDRAVLGLAWLLQPVWRPLAAFGLFFSCWINTREYRRALMALPAALLAALVLGISTWHYFFGQQQVRRTYREANRVALESHDYSLSALYDQKLATLGEDTQRSQFKLAETLAAEGNTNEAYERMKLLAPEDRLGYPEAHFWIIQRLLSDKLDENPSDSQRLAKLHIAHLNTLGVDIPLVDFFNALCQIRDNKLEEAVRTLKPIVLAIPDAAFKRMQINLTLKRLDQAKQDARALVTHMKTRSRRNAQLSEIDYKWWLEAERVLGNLSQMRVILERWQSEDQENEVACQALAAVYREQAANMMRDPVPDEQQVIELWLKSAKLDDSAASILKLSRALYAERNKTPVYAGMLTALHQSPQTPTALLISMGTEIAQQSQFEDAKPFFAAAIAKDDSNPIAWNNYALVIAESAQPDLDKALDASNKSIAIMPKEHRFRETRGQIFLKMQRWQEAIDDLEFALNGLPSLTAIHKSLAIAYQALGQEELARLHREQAE